MGNSRPDQVKPEFFHRSILTHSQSSNIERGGGGGSVGGGIGTITTATSTIAAATIGNNKKDCTLSNSKIPILNPNLRISKCASWAGRDCPHATDIQDLTPGKNWIYFYPF